MSESSARSGLRDQGSKNQDIPTEALKACLTGVRPDGQVLDLGCFGFRQVEHARALGLTGLRHAGVDYCDPPGLLPEGFTFRKARLGHDPIPFDDDRFDLVVASHIIEHVTEPVEFFGECARVCKPGGTIYVEAPSERSLAFPGMPFAHDKFFSLSFFDDPTHVSRPWTPQSFHRLARYFGCEPVRTGYIYGSRKLRWLFPLVLIKALLTKDARLLQTSCWLAFGWCSFLVARKPPGTTGKPEFGYYIPSDR